MNVYKEKDYTSHDVVAIIRKMFGKIKTGHTGTLDPNAEGVLPICIGRATKLAGYLTAENKSYRAQLLLGTSTDTYDHTGQVLRTSPIDPHKINAATIKEATDFFTGVYMQEPPMYSAIKVNGKKLYKLAREGKTIERKPRQVKISRIVTSDFDPESNSLWLEVDCSKGTYIRSLCADIGNRLGCGGCMGELIRTKSGAFDLSSAKRLSEIAKEDIENIIVPINRAFPALQGFVTESIKAALNGKSVQLEHVRFDENNSQLNEDAYCWLFHENKIIGLYTLEEDRLRLEVMIHENSRE